jgi:PIN domain nuclease of toxin-antitoxin system
VSVAAAEKLLLDTHALLWWATADRALSRKVRRAIEDEATVVVVSAATAWEIATKVRLGRLRWARPGSLESYCAEQGFEILPISFAHAERAGSWREAHGDPFDRMLAAQSAIEGIPLATNDAKLAAFGVETVW